MTQATRSLTSTSTTASLLTASANTALKWQLPNWSVAASSSGSSCSSSFSQMLADIGRSSRPSADRPALDDSGSRRNVSRSRTSESSVADDREPEASVREDRRLASDRSPCRPVDSGRSDRSSPTQDPLVDASANTPENSESSDPQSAQATTPTADRTGDEPASSTQASDQVASSASDPSSDSGQPSAEGDDAPASDQAQASPLIGQVAIEQMMATVTLESLMAQASSTAAMMTGQTTAPVTPTGSENKKASPGASSPSSAKASLEVSPLMVAADQSADGQTPASNGSHASGLPLTSDGASLADTGAKPDAKAEIKADFAQKLSEHRPIESLLSPTGEKKSATLLTGSATTSQASAGHDRQLQESADQSNIAQVARGLQNAFKQGGGSVTLRLTPAELGSVRVQLDVQDGVVQAKFTAESQAAGDLLTHQMDQLRQALQKQGLQVDRLEVQIPANASAQASNLSERSSPDSQNPTAWADEGRSRGQMQDSPGQQARQERSDSSEPEPSFSELLNTTA